MQHNYPSTDEQKMDETLKWLLYFLGGIVIVLILFILFSFKKSGPIVVSLLTIGPAYLLGGGIIGFLFVCLNNGGRRWNASGLRDGKGGNSVVVNKMTNRGPFVN